MSRRPEASTVHRRTAKLTHAAGMRFLRYAVCGVLLIGGGLAAFLFGATFFGREARFARAQARWDAQAPVAYQAEIVQMYRISDLLPTVQTCTMLVEVRAAEPPRMLAGACPMALDVAAIFTRFSPYVAAPLASRRCGYGGCVCALSTFQATYDPQYGYPTRIERDWNDASSVAAPLGRIVARLPVDLRASLMRYAELPYAMPARYAEPYADDCTDLCRAD